MFFQLFMMETLYKEIIKQREENTTVKDHEKGLRLRYEFSEQLS